MTQNICVGFIGLGVMGFPMAGYLAKAGYRMQVYNRSTAKAEAWAKQYSGITKVTPAAAAEGADFVLACVGNDEDLRQVTIGELGAFQSMQANAVFVDHTTASADVARELSNAALGRSLHFLDAPISGGQAGAENGQLTVMVGGHEEVFLRARPLLERYSKAVTLMGPSGSGQLTKMVNQICIAGLVQALAEGLSFGLSAGLDVHKVLDVISKGAAQSWQMENRGPTMLRDEFEFGFAVDWMRKDLGICKAEANRNGSALPVTELVDGFYAQLQELGGGRWDTSSLLRLLQQKA